MHKVEYYLALKEGNSDTCLTCMNLEDTMLSETSQAYTVRFQLYEVPKVSNSNRQENIQTESRLMVTRIWKEGEMES